MKVGDANKLVIDEDAAERRDPEMADSKAVVPFSADGTVLGLYSAKVSKVQQVLPWGTDAKRPGKPSKGQKLEVAASQMQAAVPGKIKQSKAAQSATPKYNVTCLDIPYYSRIGGNT
uniref:Uncharacterized protein n=1 Tax=Romanomermis culicivorax TaxID=13658 RepID=A0A915HPL7_ROMCU